MGTSQKEPTWLALLSSKGGVALICGAIVGLHLIVAATGGLLAPSETSLAETARLLSEGSAPETPSLLEPPLTTWLSSAGLRAFGRSAFAVRALPVLLASLLLVFCGLLCFRYHGRRTAAWLLFAAMTTPLWAARAGQLSDATLTTASLLLVACSLATLDKLARARPIWLAPSLGVGIGISLIAGGPAGATIALLTVIGFLALSGERETEASPRLRLIAGGIVVVGVILVIVGLRHGETGWPSASSIFRSFCQIEEGERSATMVWWGTVTFAAGLVVLRFRAARSLGLHVSGLVAALIGLPWYLVSWLSADMIALCATLPLPDAIGRPGAPEIADMVQRLGYGLFPWMAFLPYGVLLITSWMREEVPEREDRAGGPYRSSPESEEPEKTLNPEPLGLALVVWAAASICTALFGASPSTTALVSSAVALAVICGVGLSLSNEGSQGLAAKRTTFIVGAFLMYVVLRDLREEPTLFTSAALPSLSAMVPSTEAAVLWGASSVVALAVLMVASLELSRKWPEAFRTAVASAREWSMRLLWLSIAGCTVLLLAQGVIPLSRTSSWAEVFEVYQREHEENEPIYAYHELGADASFHIDEDEIERLDDSEDVTRVLNRRSGRVFFATRTASYRQLSEMIGRLTGERPHPLNTERHRHLLVVFDGPRPDDVTQPAPVVSRVPRGLRRDPERMASGAIELVGADIIAENARPGDTVGAVAYYRCRRSMARDLDVTIILQEADGEERHTFEHIPTHGRYPTSEWAVDSIVEDRMEVVVPDGAPSGRWEVLVEAGSESGPRSSRRLLGRFNIEE